MSMMDPGRPRVVPAGRPLSATYSQWRPPRSAVASPRRRRTRQSSLRAAAAAARGGGRGGGRTDWWRHFEGSCHSLGRGRRVPLSWVLTRCAPRLCRCCQRRRRVAHEGLFHVACRGALFWPAAVDGRPQPRGGLDALAAAAPRLRGRASVGRGGSGGVPSAVGHGRGTLRTNEAALSLAELPG